MTNARIRLYAAKGGNDVIYDGQPSLDFKDFLDQRGATWGIVDIGSFRMCGTFRIRHGLYEGRWWEFGQHNDYELLEHMLAPANLSFT
jgi:hypothetical protein